MNRLPAALLLGLCLCTTQAAEPPATEEEQAAAFFKVFRGQWNFLKGSTDLCVEKVPAMKREFERAREHAETQIARAETIVADETEGNRAGYKPLIDRYANLWIKHAEDLLTGLKKQNASRACPDLLGNWQATDTDQVLGDWRTFLERSDPVPMARPEPEALHGA